jgi:type II secretory pathway predicted ATPase ExeA
MLTMYESHFGLRQRPFRTIPDSEHYYPATSHEAALAQLLQGIEEDEGLMLLTGEPGTGKTIIGHCLLDRLGDQVSSAFLTNSRFGSRLGLLQAILHDLCLRHEGRSEQELRLTLTDFLLKNYEAARRTVVIIDEAQHLTPDILEELRLLGNLESRHGKALQTILLALPDIGKTLSLPELAALNQRLAVRLRLEPLGFHEAADYLVQHLRAQGGKAEAIVSDEALAILARGTKGIPRLLNRAMHQAFKLTHQAGQSLVDAEAALEALAVCGLADGPNGEAEPFSPNSAEQEEPDLQAQASEIPGLPRPRSATQDDLLADCDSPDSSRSHRLFVPPRRPA